MQTVDGFTHFVNENEEAVFTLGSLFAVDANGKPTDALTYSFVPVKGNANQVIVTVTLDNDYLTAADRAFPVVIDPTVTVSSSQTADTCVCSYFPSTNYYLGTNLRTGYDSDYGIRRSYLRFEIPSSISAGSIIDATLDLEKVSGVVPTVRAYRVTSSWSSSTLTWNNKPGYTTSGQSSQSVVFREGSAWYTMNVMSIVNSWVNGYSSNYGFVLIDNTENNADHWTTYYSSDAVSPHKPELIISYSDSDETPPSPNPDPDPEPEPEPETVKKYVTIHYDYNSRNSLAEIETAFLAASEGIKNAFGIEFIISSWMQDSSLNGNSCTHTNIGETCNNNCGAAILCGQLHHKSGSRLVDVNPSTTTEYTCRIVSHMLCFYKVSELKHKGCYGMADVAGTDTVVSTISSDYALYIQHELSHNLGATHDACTSDQPCYSRYIMNEWCDACRTEILANIGGWK